MRNGRYPTAVIILCSAAICCLACPSPAQNTGPVGANLSDTQQQPVQNQPVQNQAVQNQAVPNQALPNPVMQQPPTQPFPQLSPQHIKYIDDLLGIWEQSSSQVKRYTCDYMCWEYDPEFCNWRDPGNNKLAAYMIKTGEIRFSDPDKARFETSALWGFDGPPAEPGQDPKYQQRDKEENRERWICDGKAIYEFDFQNQRLYETDIPAEMQGQGLANSPLPFLFGAKKEQVLARYWVRVITPQGAVDEYWLEAWPKRREDAQTYQKIELVIAKEDFLPKSLHIYAPNYDAVKNPVSRAFEFQNRKINSNWSNIQNALGWFVRPQTPIGWKRVDRNQLQSPQQSMPPGGLIRPAAAPTDQIIK